MFDFDVLKLSVVGEKDEDERRVTGLNTVRLDAPVTEVPRGPALTLSPETTVAAAIESMRRRRRGAAVIIQNQRPLGVVTDREILAHPGSDAVDWRTLPVASVMSSDAPPLRDLDSVATALRAMCAHRQWHLPIVCARGLLVGALDIADLSLWLRDRLTLLSVDAAFA